MRLNSVSGRLRQILQLRLKFWRAFIGGWLRRQQNGFVPCAFAGCDGLLQVPLREFYESYEFFCEHRLGIRELNFFLGKLGAHEVFYDIGGFRGAYSAAAKLKLGKNVSVHVFEPLPKNVEAIRRVSTLNRFEDFHINPLAVSDGTFLVGSVNEQDAMLRLGDTKTTAKTEFSAITLDEYITAGAPPPTVMKIDVDGFEMHVLRGARKCLTDSHPRLWLEVHPGFLAEQKKSTDDVFNLLRETGYTISIFEDHNWPGAKNSYHVCCE